MFYMIVQHDVSHDAYNVFTLDFNTVFDIVFNMILNMIFNMMFHGPGVGETLEVPPGLPGDTPVAIWRHPQKCIE